MSEFKKYKRKEIAELRPYKDGEKLSDRVSISKADKESGSPKVGDMIARNPKNHGDQWLVEKNYFEDNFEPIEDELDIIEEPKRTPIKIKISGKQFNELKGIMGEIKKDKQLSEDGEGATGGGATSCGASSGQFSAPIGSIIRKKFN